MSITDSFLLVYIEYKILLQYKIQKYLKALFYSN